VGTASDDLNVTMLAWYPGGHAGAFE
jgi:hypothetical protein